MGAQRGQATVEWTAVTLLVAAALGVAGTLAIAAPWLPRAVRCAVLAGCHGEDAELGAAYGDEVAALVRAYAPNLAYERGTLTLPVDYRRCRSRRCSDAPELEGSDVWRSSRGERATVFTRVVDRRSEGGYAYVQYWLYYPDSTYNEVAHRANRAGGRLLALTPAGRLIRTIAGHHADDWESYQVRVDGSGAVWARASAHHGYAGRKRLLNLNEVRRVPAVPVVAAGRTLRVRKSAAWTPVTGWTRVSRGSHAGHLVDGPRGERRTEADGVALVPVERLSGRDRAPAFAVTPPWGKAVYSDPEAVGTG